MIPQSIPHPARNLGSRHQRARQPDIASEVLHRIAERARENPPRDMQKLTASAAKFLLVNLEPAMQLAEELREMSVNRSARSLVEGLVDGRQDRAMTLLLDPNQ